MTSWHVSPDAAWTVAALPERNSTTHAWAVTLVPDGPPLVLDGPSALIWDALLAHDGEDEIVADVVEAAGADVEEAQEDIVGLLHQLEDLGLAQSFGSSPLR